MITDHWGRRTGDTLSASFGLVTVAATAILGRETLLELPFQHGAAPGPNRVLRDVSLGQGNGQKSRQTGLGTLTGEPLLLSWPLPGSTSKHRISWLSWLATIRVRPLGSIAK